MHRASLLTTLALASLLAGCTANDGARSGLVSVNGVSGSSGNVDLVGTGINVTADTANGTVGLSLPRALQHNGTLEACRSACSSLGLPDGMVIADGSLVSLNNLSLNAGGPDHDSAVFFYDDGHITGQALRWDDAHTRFELSRDLDALGNVTARHHVGTVTTIVLGGAQAGQLAQIATAALEGNEAGVFLRGSGKLVNGTARIDFPATFKVLVAGNVTAQVPPTSRGQALMVSEKASDHIVIETVTGAASDQTFDYFIQATRAASEDFQTVRNG